MSIAVTTLQMDAEVAAQVAAKLLSFVRSLPLSKSAETTATRDGNRSLAVYLLTNKLRSVLHVECVGQVLMSILHHQQQQQQAEDDHTLSQRVSPPRLRHAELLFSASQSTLRKGTQKLLGPRSNLKSKTLPPVSRPVKLSKSLKGKRRTNQPGHDVLKNRDIAALRLELRAAEASRSSLENKSECSGTDPRDNIVH